MTAEDPFELQRFVVAQNPLCDQIERELRAGRKITHWMWFAFPQIAGLGNSSMSRRYSIASREEAQAYLAHEILGARLRRWTDLVNSLSGRTAGEIFGSPDDLKFHSCMTLFSAVSGKPDEFSVALEKYFDGEQDQKTLNALKRSATIG